MSTRKERIEAETAALWRELYDEPPPASTDGDMLDLMLRRLPDVGYERLASPYLRRANMSFPKRPGLG